jgi:hypothetical protein
VRFYVEEETKASSWFGPGGSQGERKTREPLLHESATQFSVLVEESCQGVKGDLRGGLTTGKELIYEKLLELTDAILIIVYQVT